MPQLSESSDYANKRYYRSVEHARRHDGGQRLKARKNWSTLSGYLNLRKWRRFLDLGASGAWSDVVKQNIPEADCTVLEPSWEVTELSRLAYPDITAIQGIAEDYEAPPGSYDFITLFNSIYAMSRPIEVLQKVRRLLTPEGRVLLVISHPLMEVEVWQNGSPWVNLDAISRTINLVMYSRRTLQRTLEYCGFTAERSFVYETPTAGWSGRQRFAILARPTSLPHVESRLSFFSNPREVAWSNNTVGTYCELTSKRSLNAYLEQGDRPAAAVLVHVGVPAYAEWVQRLLSEETIQSIAFDLANMTAEQRRQAATEPQTGDGRFHRRNVQPDELRQSVAIVLRAIRSVQTSLTVGSLHVFLIGRHNMSAADWQEALPNVVVVDAACSVNPRAYPELFLNIQNETVIGHAFAPSVSPQVSLFPFPKPAVVNAHWSDEPASSEKPA